MKIEHDSEGWFAIGDDGYSTTQYFPTKVALQRALSAEEQMCKAQGLNHLFCVPAGSPIEWDY